MAQTQLPFYLTLPSDASLDIYPSNHASVWVTKLQGPIILLGRWEVALVELTYPQTMYNVYKHQSIIVNQGVLTTEKDGKDAVSILKETIRVPPGIYTTEQLIAHVERNIPPLRTPDGSLMAQRAFRIFSDPSERKTRIEFPTLRLWLEFPEDSVLLQGILGFSGKVVGYDKQNKSYDIEMTDLELLKAKVVDERFNGYDDQPTPPNLPVDITYTVVSKKAINTSLGNQSLFVQSDIADLSVVGDSMAPLLRSVPVRAESAFQLVQARFDKPHYVPIGKTCLDSIRIEITNDIGQDVKFQSGKSMVKLHCRPAHFS